MKKIVYSVISVILLFLGSACEKDDNEIKGTANITVINAAIGNGAIRVNPGLGGGFSYAKASDIAYGTSAGVGAFTGTNNITVVKTTDTTNILFQRSIALQPISTLYISGQAPAIDTMYRVESNFPYIQASKLDADNSVYIRFVNLSPNSAPLNVNIRSSVTNEVSGLAYKGITAFKKYDAPTTAASYIFEVRDAATNIVIFTYTLPLATFRYKTLSIVIGGLVPVLPITNPAPPASATPVIVFPVSYT